MKKNFKILILVIVGCLLFTGCGENKSAVDDKITLNAPNNINVETFYSTDNSTLILKLTNNSNEDINDLDIVSTYPTAQNSLISEDEFFMKNFKANSTTYASLMLPINDDFESYIPNKINLDIKTESENIEGIKDTSSMVNNVKLEYYVDENDKVIDFNLTNNTGKILGSVSSLIVYFKDDKPIATDIIDAINVEDTYNTKRDILYVGYEDNIKYIDYDNIEVYITSITDDYEEPEEDDEDVEEGYYDENNNEIIDDEPIEQDEDMEWD